MSLFRRRKIAPASPAARDEHEPSEGEGSGFMEPGGLVPTTGEDETEQTPRQPQRPINVEREAGAVRALAETISDEDFKKLPDEFPIKRALRAHPAFQLRHFLPDVAKGKQEEAEALLIETPANKQTLLTTPGVFTDYSGRTFNCTAYEYAYWAKDTHMCRMLAGHMDDETKRAMLGRIAPLDPATGLPVAFDLGYQQHGVQHHSAHFELTDLRAALQRYIDGYGNWFNTQPPNWDAMTAAWMDVGVAQRDVPAHVAQEYCRPDRSFHPTPQFNEETLPRGLAFYDFHTGRAESWFPLTASTTSGLGFDFALMRARGRARAARPRAGDGRQGAAGVGETREAGWSGASCDLAAIARLDEERTVDLTLSRARLEPRANSPGMSPM